MRKVPTSQSNEGLSSQQKDAIRLITSGCTVRYAALVLKIKHSVIKSWISNDEQFKAALAQQIDGAPKINGQGSNGVKPKRSPQKTNPAKRP